MDAKRREQLESQLSAYLDGELTPAEQREVKAFLAGDREARALLEELRATVSAVRSLPRARAPEDLMESLRGRLERRALLGEGQPADMARQAARPFHGRWIAAAAVIALTFVAGYFMWPLGQEEPAGRPAGPQYALRTPGSEEPAAPPVPEAAETPELTLAPADKTGGTTGRRGKHPKAEEHYSVPEAAPAAPSPPAALDYDHTVNGMDLAYPKGAHAAARDKLEGGALADAGEQLREAGLKPQAKEPVIRESGYLAPTKAVGEDEPASRAVPGGHELRGAYLAPSEYLRQADHLYVLDYAETGVRAGGVRYGFRVPSEDVTVVELAFADGASQREAVSTLCKEYAFRAVTHTDSGYRRALDTGADGNGPTVTVLALDVADKETLTTIASRLQADTDAAYRRTLGGPETGRAGKETVKLAEEQAATAEFIPANGMGKLTHLHGTGAPKSLAKRDRPRSMAAPRDQDRRAGREEEELCQRRPAPEAASLEAEAGARSAPGTSESSVLYDALAPSPAEGRQRYLAVGVAGTTRPAWGEPGRAEVAATRAFDLARRGLARMATEAKPGDPVATLGLQATRPSLAPSSMPAGASDTGRLSNVVRIYLRVQPPGTRPAARTQPADSAANPQ